MTKRRRERDRPKAAPDAPYNPNKRIHLSYADSDEEDAQLEEQPRNIAPQDIPAKSAYTTTESRARNGRNVPDVGAGISSNGASPTNEVEDGAENEAEEEEYVPELQFRLDDYDEEEEDHDGNHEADFEARVTSNKIGQSSDRTSTRSQRDPNQSWKHSKRAADPAGCIEIPEDGDDGEGSDQEVASYIRSVQSQRMSIPQIMFAKTTEATQNALPRDDVDEEIGYDDGAFVARSRTAPAAIPNDESLDPKAVFTENLIRRFRLVRQQMHLESTLEEVSSLAEDCLVSYPYHNKKATKMWLDILRTKAPQTAQIRALDESTALRLLDLIQESCLMKCTNLETATSAWVWALLARLDDVSNMHNDDIFPLRQLGKKALFVHLSFANPAAAAGIEALDGEDEYHPRPEREDEQAPEPPHADSEGAEGSSERTGITPITPNTSATLDMILTVVGEVFGQKDLLQFRQSWNV